MTDYSDFVIYADESGDHSLVKIDPGYPVFVLCLCVFRKRDYVERVVPEIQRLKFRWFGHDAVVLHERDIRKQEGAFARLTTAALKDAFLRDLNDILRRSRVLISACVIEKSRLVAEHLFYDNPYTIALEACLDQVAAFLARADQLDRTTHFLFERRGQREDRELELEFLRITSGQNRLGRKLTGFEIKLVDKKANSSGLQIADLTARPIGLCVLRPQQPNRAFDIISEKLKLGSKTRKIVVFP